METFIKSVEGNDFIFSEIFLDGAKGYEVIIGGNELEMIDTNDQFRFANPKIVPDWLLALEGKLSDAILNRRPRFKR